MKEKLCPACGHNRFIETSWEKAEQTGVRIVKEPCGNWVADYDYSDTWDLTGTISYSMLECMRCHAKYDHQDFLIKDTEEYSDHLCLESCSGISNCPYDWCDCDYGRMLMIERSEFIADSKKEEEILKTAEG